MPRLPAAELPPGTRIGRYVVERRIGSGGMGVVYSAWDTELARDVALKVVRRPAELDAMQDRLRREAKAMARLSHPNVVPVFDIGSHDGQLFIAMELVSGETLRSWVTNPRPWRGVAQLFAKAGRGLAAAHSAGLLHRDFKPDNVMVGRGDEPRITDFGLARELDEAVESTSPSTTSAGGALAPLTATGSLVGTPAYMAPEQLLGQPGGREADQFGFCVALFEVLHGARPFWAEASRPEALLAEIRAGRIAKPAARRVPGWLHAAIVRGLAFDPAQRWPSMLALVEVLERGLRTRRRLDITVAVIAIIIAVGLRTEERPAPSCLEASHGGNDAVTILVCTDEYVRTSDPELGVHLANALRRTGHLDKAAAVANELLATPAGADALYTLGKVAVDAGRHGEAARSLRLAGELHRERHQWASAAEDLLALAETSNDVVDQLASLDQAVSDARAGNAPRIEAHCHVAAAVLLSEIGARDSALSELDRAEPLMTRPRDRVRIDLERGNVHQNLGEGAPAIAAFERARAGAEAATIAGLALQVRLNLGYSLVEEARLADAAIQLKAASALDPRDEWLSLRLSLEARIAARGGDPARAAGLAERALATTDAHATGELLEREVERAEIALLQGELATAEHWARRAIARIEALRSTTPPVELRSWMVTARRAPYEILFAALAGRGDASGALVVFDRYRGAGVLAGLARFDSGAAPASGIAFPIAELARLLPALQTSALATPAPEAATLEAARAASLLALVVARGELWRITADAGRLQVARIGPLAALRPQLDRLRTAPGDPAAAAALGAALVPVELARPGDRMLHVVLDEPLAWLPVAALRIGDRRLSSARPIVHAPRIADLGCAETARGPERPERPQRVVAIGALGAPGASDALGASGAPDAIGGLAPSISLAPREATRASLFAVARTDLLHLAAPAQGDAIVLGEDRVRALEIAAHGGVPAQVVLAAPHAGPAGTASLAMAFVAAGADQVIATIRPVSIATIARFTDRLYRLDRAARSDFARALARIHAGDAGDAGGASNDDWLGFAAFGRATCNPQP